MTIPLLCVNVSVEVTRIEWPPIISGGIMKQIFVFTFVVFVSTALGWLALTTPIGYYIGKKCIAVENRSGHLVRCTGAPRHEAVQVAPWTTFEDLLLKRFKAAVARGDEIAELTYE